MVRIAYGNRPHSKFPGFFNTHLHGPMSSHLTQTISSINEGCGSLISDNLEMGWNPNHPRIRRALPEG